MKAASNHVVGVAVIAAAAAAAAAGSLGHLFGWLYRALVGCSFFLQQKSHENACRLRQRARDWGGWVQRTACPDFGVATFLSRVFFTGFEGFVFDFWGFDLDDFALELLELDFGFEEDGDFFDFCSL